MVDKTRMIHRNVLQHLSWLGLQSGSAVLVPLGASLVLLSRVKRPQPDSFKATVGRLRHGGMTSPVLT